MRFERFFFFFLSVKLILISSIIIKSAARKHTHTHTHSSYNHECTDIFEEIVKKEKLFIVCLLPERVDSALKLKLFCCVFFFSFVLVSVHTQQLLPLLGFRSVSQCLLCVNFLCSVLLMNFFFFFVCFYILFVCFCLCVFVGCLFYLISQKFRFTFVHLMPFGFIRSQKVGALSLSVVRPSVSPSVSLYYTFAQFPTRQFPSF